jgi:rare lipoprotein A|tara:strand:- start:652 stop:999 length:348 start_codon:yes stop_codon:yes gene_type:complete
MKAIIAVTLLTGLLFVDKGGNTTASWYGEKYRGKATASGEPFNPDELTAAMWDVPFGTKFRVYYGKKFVVVRINDRGPAKSLKRGIDLSKAAFKRLAPTEIGLIKVRLEKLGKVK